MLPILNDTLLMLMYTANIMSTLPNGTEVKNLSNLPAKNDVATINVSKQQNKTFELLDDWYMWRCYQPFGCFYIGEPWYGENRPVVDFPMRPDKIGPRYLLYTRNTLNNPDELKIDQDTTIRNAHIRPDGNVYFIIHGYLENGDKTWVLRMTKELLHREDCNVVVVNWLTGAGPPYTQAVANTRLVGAMTARLAAQFIKIGSFEPSRVHVIGHSLGAHTAGYVGYNLRVRYGLNLGRITGLDPAEPHFSNTSPMVRLDPTDADFVAVIHTDCNPFISGGLGITQPVGHIDFYPNDGRNQPGCNEGVLDSITLERGSFVRGLRRFLGCNHIRSYEYFIESINTACPFLAVPCSSWTRFQEGGCFDCVNQYCPRFGFDAQRGNYHASTYLMTAGAKPFCRGHYRVKINISKTAESMNHGGEVGIFVLRVIGEDGRQTERMQFSEDSKYYGPGTTHTIVLPGEVVGKPKAVEVTWEYQVTFNPLTWRLITKPMVYLDSVVVDSLESNSGIKVCPDESKTLIANEPKVLTVDNCNPVMANIVTT
ncbi:inactive pancreatic lipase-related protein 1 isoform X1 [Neodiprion pinetum]|uniref:inactive pancreatic lipase-related protein 1 isoform X1 n=2 Tax=Neodiprion pinetum TaxID=441929 RepID=UPI001EDDB628|nr:inactive pancreatic lipase-related protein 1-like isoform X1 [Neodiprion pinetum]